MVAVGTEISQHAGRVSRDYGIVWNAASYYATGADNRAFADNQVGENG
jgi:hypothetical protein